MGAAGQPNEPGRVRAKLAATAALALVLGVIMAALTLQTMRSARLVEAQARSSHERMRAFWTLQDAAKRLQRVTYAASRFDGVPPDPQVDVARSEYLVAVATVLALPRRPDQGPEEVRRIEQRSMAVLALIDDAPAIGRRIQGLWDTAGYRGALQELTRFSTPYDEFNGLIHAEVTAAGEQFARTTQRAAQSQSLLRAVALTLLGLGIVLAGALFFVLLKRLTLAKANAALATEDERRRRFLVDASHELRMPLTIIRGESEVVLRRPQGLRPEVVDALERILVQTRAASRMLDDLFLIARAEAGGLRMNLRPIDVARLARDTVADVSTLACETGASLTCRADPPLYAVADADRLRQALTALLDNALRHTRPGVRIHVETRLDAGQVLLEVNDDGPGIDPADAPELFRRFRRGGTRSDGSGLGLTVVRALTEAHGGTVDIDRAPAGGARVSLRLPAATGAAADPVLEEDRKHELAAAG